jgi:hypothetical protein
MKTKKDIKMLLESGLSSAFVAKLNDTQMKSLVERFSKEGIKEAVSVTPSTGFKTTATAGDEFAIDDTIVKAKGPVEVISKDRPGVAPKTEGEMTEKFESKAQQGFFWAKCNTSKGVKKKKWCELAKKMSDKTPKKQYKTMPEKKNPEKMDESYEKFLEDRIVEMIEKRVNPKMTKGDILKTISEKVSNESMMLRNPKKMSMFSSESGIESKRMNRPTHMKPITGPMEENETKEKERTKEKEAPTKPGTTPKRRGNPFKNPNPGVKEKPRGEKKTKEKIKQDFIGLIKQSF